MAFPPDLPDDDATRPEGEASTMFLGAPEQPTMALIKDRYTVLRPLGRGGMGEVFLCRDATLDLTVAVKFPTGALSERFLDEARNASRLNHPNIARLYHYDYEPGGRPFIVMEYVEGECLSYYLRQSRLSPERSVEIVDAVLAALEEAHRNGIIHRDIKPRNIMITSSGQVKVLDFGLAKRIRQSQDPLQGAEQVSPAGIHHTGVGRAVGTARYMAPEQARGEDDLDERCDIFAVGAVLYECLTGQPAFSGNTGSDSVVPVQERPVPPPSTLAPGIPPVLDQMVIKALAKGREDRYPSAAAMRAALPRRKTGRPLWRAVAETVRETIRKPLRLAAIACFLVFLYFVPDLYDQIRDFAERHPPEAVRLYEEGLVAIRDGTHSRASRALERAVAIDPRYHAARARLAESLFELEYTDRANSELLKVLGETGLRGNDALLTEALRLTFSNNTDGAAKKYKQLADRCSGAEKAQALVDLGRSLERGNKPKDALKQYQAAIELNPAYPAAFLRTGILLERMKRGAEAEKSFRRAEELYQALSNPEGQAELWYQRGRLAAEQRRTKEAMEALNQSLSLARVSGSPYQEIQALFQISGVQNLQAETAEAERTARTAIEMARRAGIANLAARGQINLGNTYMTAGDYDKAEPAYREALDYSRRHELGRQAARALFSLASFHSHKGQSDLVIQEVDQASVYFRQGGYARELKMCAQLRTRALRQLGRFEEALSAAQAQIKTLDPQADRTQLADLEDTVASTLAALERYPEAMPVYQKVEEVNRGLGDKIGVGFALAAMARIGGKLGDFETADRCLREASQIVGASKSGLKSLLGLLTLAEAESELIRGRNDSAARKARQALQIAQGQQRSNTAIEARLVLAQAASRSGAGRNALLAASEAAGLAENYGEPYLKWRAQAVLAEAALAAGDLAAARSAGSAAAEAFSQSGQLDSGWRAQALLAEALRRLGEQGPAADAGRNAASMLERMRAAWPADRFKKYMARPDLAARPYQRFSGKETAYDRTQSSFLAGRQRACRPVRPAARVPAA